MVVEVKLYTREEWQEAVRLSGDACNPPEKFNKIDVRIDRLLGGPRPRTTRIVLPPVPPPPRVKRSCPTSELVWQIDPVWFQEVFGISINGTVVVCRHQIEID